MGRRLGHVHLEEPRELRFCRQLLQPVAERQVPLAAAT